MPIEPKAPEHFTLGPMPKLEQSINKTNVGWIGDGKGCTVCADQSGEENEAVSAAEGIFFGVGPEMDPPRTQPWTRSGPQEFSRLFAAFCLPVADALEDPA